MARAKAEKAEPATEDKKPSQMAMVRTALDEVGGDPKPRELQEYIRQKFDTEIPANIISNYKSQINKRKRDGGGAAAAPTGGRGRGRPAGGTGNLRFEDLETVRGLVSRLGADQVRRMVELLG